MANQIEIEITHRQSFEDGKVDSNYLSVSMSRKNRVTRESFMIDVDSVPLLVEKLKEKLESIK